MALYSRKEFIELCGHTWDDSSRAKIAMWIKRGKVIEQNGKIDDSNTTNRDWALKQRDTQSVRKPDIIPDTGFSEEPKPQREIDFPGGASGETIERRLKLHQIEKLKVDTRIAELKEEKIRAEVVPITLIKDLFSTHTQSIITSQKDGIEELLTTLSVEARLSGEQLARLRGKMVDILNKGVDKAITITERNMKATVEEFSIKKEVGEHD
jgi:hypothetical protein